MITVSCAIVRDDQGPRIDAAPTMHAVEGFRNSFAEAIQGRRCWLVRGLIFSHYNPIEGVSSSHKSI